MSSGPFRCGWAFERGLEALSLGLAYGAGLCCASVCLVASFQQTSLNVPYWQHVPGLRTDTCGIAALLVGATCFTVSEYLRLCRHRDPMPDRQRASAATGLVVRAISETMAIVATGLVIYISVNSVTHAATLGLPVSHLVASPTEGTVRVVALLLCVCSITVIRYLLIGPTLGRTTRTAMVSSRSADYGRDHARPNEAARHRRQASTASYLYVDPAVRAGKSNPVPANESVVSRLRPSTIVTRIIAAAIVLGVIFLTMQLIFFLRGHSHLTAFGVADPHLIDKKATVQASQLAEMKSIGITSIRLDADWAMVQSGGPHTFDWRRLDQVVHSARAAGFSVDLIIDGCPPWAAVAGARGSPSPQPASPAQYARWAAEVAARYAPQGVDLFEIWNEPNNFVAWQPAPDPIAYTADLVAAYAAIKTVDPSAFIISGGLAPGPTYESNISPVGFLKEMYAHGAKGSFDALGFHPYSYPALPDAYETWSGWSQMVQTNPSLRSLMTSNGDAGKPIWITEFGAPSRGPGGVGDTAQATAFRQAIAQADKTTWIGAFYIYSWQDLGTDSTNVEDWFGLLTADGSPKPAYNTVAALRNSR
jgi:polysaccharide biosynthesis protein PslG